jgi:hypothetical protein
VLSILLVFFESIGEFYTFYFCDFPFGVCSCVHAGCSEILQLISLVGIAIFSGFNLVFEVLIFSVGNPAVVSLIHESGLHGGRVCCTLLLEAWRSFLIFIDTPPN